MLTSTAKDFTLLVSYLSFWDQVKRHILVVSRETVFCSQRNIIFVLLAQEML